MLPVYFELNELVRDVEIGCDPAEYGVRQQVVISMRVALDSQRVFCGDTDQPAYDYCHMVEMVDAAIASQARFILQETLFLEIASRVLAHPLIVSVGLRFSKTQRYADCRSIGIQATLTQADVARLRGETIAIV